MSEKRIEHWPSRQEITFLNPAYNFIYNIFEEVEKDDFWNKDPYYRFSKTRDALLTYSELLEYEPIRRIIEVIRKIRPPIEAELSREFLMFMRNLLIHFPFFNKWDEVEFSRTIINWSKQRKSIDQFLNKYSGTQEIKYRTWNPAKKEMTYVSIKFPQLYVNDEVIRLNQIIDEKGGVRAVMSLMKSILNSQIITDEDLKQVPTSSHTAGRSAS